MGTAIDKKLKAQLDSRKKFVRKPYEVKLAYHNKRKHASNRLPFAGPGGWDVPNTGGYTGGCDTGSALAVMYLKHLRQNGAAPCGSLQHIVLGMIENAHGSPETLSLRGQVVGFFSLLDAWLAEAAKICGSNLDEVTPKELLKLANDGLNFDYDAYMASLTDD